VRPQATWEGVVHKVRQSVGLMLAASALAIGPLVWTLCTAIIDEGGGMVGGYQNEKGTHPIRQGGEASAPSRGHSSEMIDSFC
jgi:hypothetical protein